jgi:hypothetical protein
MVPHPVIQTLERVRDYLRGASPTELRRVSDAAGLSPRALRHAERDNWQPRPSTLVALDLAIYPPDSTLGTTVPSVKETSKFQTNGSTQPSGEEG